MLYWVNKILVWLRRSKYSRGFGVQSPWAYQFIRYVINEHYPYYSYAELKKSLPDISSRESKVAKLYFRIANYRQADVVLSYNCESSVYDKYISAACHKTAVKHLDNASQLPSGTIEMLILPIVGDYQTIFESALQHVDEKTIFVVEGIYEDAHRNTFWQQIVSDSRCITTFDLYECGVIFFDSKRYKENYIVNF